MGILRGITLIAGRIPQMLKTIEDLGVAQLRLGHSMLGPETAAGEDAEILEMSRRNDGFRWIF